MNLGLGLDLDFTSTLSRKKPLRPWRRCQVTKNALKLILDIRSERVTDLLDGSFAIVGMIEGLIVVDGAAIWAHSLLGAGLQLHARPRRIGHDEVRDRAPQHEMVSDQD